MMNFKTVPVGMYFVNRHKEVFQKTNTRHARKGSGPVYRHNQNEFAAIVPNGTTCPYTIEKYWQTTNHK